MRNIILTLTFLLLGQISFGQHDTASKAAPAYREILVVNEDLIAIDVNGRLTIWDLKTLDKKVEMKDTIFEFSAVSSDQTGNIYFGTKKGLIYKFKNEENKFEPYLKLKKEVPISKIIFNSSNELFLILPDVVYDPINDKYWKNFKQQNEQLIVQKRVLYFFRKRTYNYFLMPQYTFIDNKDVIWMTSTFGEWGGSIQRFDTKKRKVINESIDSLHFGLFFPKSIFEDDKGNIYITSGLQHFTNSGEIFMINNNVAKKMYDSDNFKDTIQYSKVDSNGVVNIISIRDYGNFIGPGAFNHKDNKIYFASSKGFYRVPIPQNGTVQNQEFLFKPKLSWENEPLAIGVAMTIKKITFTTDNRLIFLTSNNGIGIYDGDKLRMLN